MQNWSRTPVILKGELQHWPWLGLIWWLTIVKLQASWSSDGSVVFVSRCCADTSLGHLSLYSLVELAHIKSCLLRVRAPSCKRRLSGMVSKRLKSHIWKIWKKVSSKSKTELGTKCMALRIWNLWHSSSFNFSLVTRGFFFFFLIFNHYLLFTSFFSSISLSVQVPKN